MSIYEIAFVFVFGFLISKYINRIRSGRCGLCGGNLYISNGETLCELENKKIEAEFENRPLEVEE